MENILMIQISKDELNKVVKDAVSEVLVSSRKLENENKLMNSKQLCQWLGISDSTLSSWKREHRIPFSRMGVKLFFKKSEVMGALKESDYKRFKKLSEVSE